MKYTKINLDQWDRGELFQFYMEHMRIVMSLTVDVDVTRLIRFTRQSGLNFYGVMVWTVSKVVNAHDEFKYGWSKGGDLIRWEVISPSYVHFHPEDQRFTKLFTPFSPDLASFHAQFLADKEAYRAACRKLASSFVENFKKYTRMSAEVVAAGPKAE